MIARVDPLGRFDKHDSLIAPTYGEQSGRHSGGTGTDNENITVQVYVPLRGDDQRQPTRPSMNHIL